MLTSPTRLYPTPRGRRLVPAARGSLVVAALAGLVWAAFGLFSGPTPAHVVRPGGGLSGDGELHTAAGRPYTFGGLVICLDRPGRAVIDRLVPYKGSGGLRVDDFVAVPNQLEIGGEPFAAADGSIRQFSQPGSAPHLAYTGTGRVVDHPCPKSFTGAPPPGGPVMKMLYAQFSKPTDGTARDDGLTIEYTSGGRHLSLTVPWYVVLCGPGDRSRDCGGTGDAPGT